MQFARIWPAIALAVPIAACGDAAMPPAPGPVAQIRAGFPPGGIADTIVVEAVERLPLRAAQLVGPDGTTTPASDVDVASNPGFATGQWTAGNPWHNAIAPGNAIPALAIRNEQAAAAVRSREQLLATVSSADIPLADPVAYRRDWQRYRIRLIFGTSPGQTETREIAAPAPAPAPAPISPGARP